MIANTTRKLARPVVAAARELARFLLGRRHHRLTTADSLPVGEPGRRATGGRQARYLYEQPVPDEVTLDPRQRSPATRTTGRGVPTPASSDWPRRHRLRRPGPPTTPPPGRHADGDHPRPLDNPSAISEVAPRRPHTDVILVELHKQETGAAQEHAHSGAIRQAMTT